MVAIQELLNSFGVSDTKQKDGNKHPKKKSRSDYIDETFLDWNLPEMSEKEFEKLVDNFDNFLRAWEKEYLKDNPQKKSKKRKNKFKPPHIDDIVQFMSLEEIREYLLDNPELTKEEKFNLYYEKYERVQTEKNSFTLNQLYKQAGISPPKNKPKK